MKGGNRPSDIGKAVENIDSRDNFIRLVEQYRHLVFSVCLKLTGDYFASEDLTQETFLSAFSHLEDFDGSNEKSWLCRIASNKSIDYCRAAARRQIPVDTDDMADVAGRASDEPSAVFSARAVLDELKTCIEALPPLYRDPARQYYLEQKSAREIADETGVNIKTVRTQLARARTMLQKSYRKELLT